MAITPQQARRELARREIARRQARAAAATPPPSTPPPVLPTAFSPMFPGLSATAAIATQPEGAATALGSIVGGVAGGMTKVPFGSSVAAGLGAGGSQALQQLMRMVQGQPVSSEELSRPFKTAATVGASSAAVEGSLRGIGLAGKTLNRVFPITTAAKARSLQSIRGKFLSTPRLAGEEFEKDLSKLVASNPTKSVDLSDVLGRLKDARATTPQISTLLSRAIRNNRAAQMVESLITQPETAKNLTLQESQTLKRVFQDALKTKFNQLSPELSDAYLELQDAYHGIRASQLASFDDLADTFSRYGDRLTKFRLLKPFFKQGRLSKGILGDLVKEPEIKEALEDLLSPETLREMTRFRVAEQGIKVAKVGAGAALAAQTPPGKALLRILGMGE